MGRTNPTFRDSLNTIRDQWADYRRGLRRRDQLRFDSLFEYAAEHADASTYLNRVHPMTPILFSIAIEQETRLDELEGKFDALEKRFDELEMQLDEMERRLDERMTQIEHPDGDEG